MYHHILIYFIIIYFLNNIVSSQTDNANSTTPPTTTAVDLCALPQSSNPKENEDNIFWKRKRSEYDGWTPSVCLLNLGQSPQCVTWRVNFIVILTQGTQSSVVQQIQNFVNTTTKNCETDSQMQFFTPGLEQENQGCPVYSIGSKSEVNFMKSLQPSVLYLSPEDNAGDTLADMLGQMADCTDNFPLSPTEGGAVMVISNVKCEDLCSTRLFTNQNDLTKRLLSQKFVLRFIFLDDDGSDIECYNHLFNACSGETANYGTLCGVNIYGSSTQSLSSVSSQYTTCAAKSDGGNPNLTTAELAMTIAVPCICCTIVCTVCAFLCYKRAKMKSKIWRRFWLTQAMNEQATGHAAGPVNFATANHYMDIKALSEANKKDAWEIVMKELTIQEHDILGNGAFANVYKAKLTGTVPLLVVHANLNLKLENQNDNEVDVAVKRLPAHADEQNRLDFFHEIDFMKKLGYHTHVISMLGCVSNQWDPLIVVELCEKGDLLRFLRKHRENVIMSYDEDCPVDAEICLRIKDLVSIAWQVSDGMNYLSSNNFIHRDVAARNVLLTKNMVAKISDFGLCRYIDSALYTAKGGRLPIKWMALESLKFYEYSPKSDVWSFAILLYEIFSIGDGPYQGIQPLEMIKHLENGNRLKQPEKCPNEIYSIMSRCWKEKTDDRPDFSEIRSELTMMLNMEDEHYAYIDVKSDPSSRNLKDMINQEITFDIQRENELSNEDDLLAALHQQSDAQDLEEEKNEDTNVDLCERGRNFMTTLDKDEFIKVEEWARQMRLHHEMTTQLADIV